MLNRDEIAAAVSVDLLRRGYSILTKPKGRRQGADIIAQEPRSKVKVFISAAGRHASETVAQEPETVRPESEVLECMKRSVYSALRMRHENQFGKGDQIALAFPDERGCRKYLTAEKPVLESLGVKILLVKDNKEVATL